MEIAIIESPFRGANLEERALNIDYAKQCCRLATRMGYAPFASHLLYPLFLDEDKPIEREAGINCGYVFWEKADIILFFVDRGWSVGMKRALERAKTNPSIAIRILSLEAEEKTTPLLDTNTYLL